MHQGLLLRLRFSRLTLLLSSLLLLGGCGAVKRDSYHTRVLYTAEDESFSMVFISPPWEVATETSTSLRLEIAAEVFGASLDDAPPTHVMIAGAVDGAAGFDTIIEELGFGDIGPDTPTIPDISDFPGIPDIPDLPGEEETGIPSYLLDVDLSNHRDVAFAELRYLTEELEGLVVNGLTTFVTEAGEDGVVFQVGIEPGIFV
ncbi:MAG: hypothetical protein ACPHRO_13220, partial [Nannocystaceae bacterium]